MSPQFSSKSPTVRRIMREAAELSNSPSADYTAEPLDSDLFEWHFTMRGPPGSAYDDGIYHGRIILPPTYPLRPPSFRFTTPNGRFEANREICLSISGHHEETWQPAWGIRTAIVALRSFMETDARGQLGGLDTPDVVRRRLAKESTAYKCATCDRSNADIIKECEDRAKETSGQSEDVVVPEELNMGFRDEMEAKKAKQEDSASRGTSDTPRSREDTDSAQLAEGFVQTAPSAPAQQSDTPAPTRTIPVPASLPPAQPQGPAPVQLRRQHNDGVPIWIDRAIVALGVLLFALVAKVLLGI